METIDELIYSEFSKVEYSVIGRIANAPIFVNNDNSDFWLIMDDYDIDVEFQKSLADNYEGIMDGYIAAAKNTSVLVLKKVEYINDANKNWAVEVENDKFYFKKYVLLYTDTAWNMLKDNILVYKEKSLSAYLVETKNFEKLKADTPDGAYSLLYGIAHKLPFLLVEMQKSKLKLSYPAFWSSSDVLKINDWVNGISDEDEDIEKYLDEIINSIGNEQD